MAVGGMGHSHRMCSQLRPPGVRVSPAGLASNAPSRTCTLPTSSRSWKLLHNWFIELIVGQHLCDAIVHWSSG